MFFVQFISFSTHVKKKRKNKFQIVSKHLYESKETQYVLKTNGAVKAHSTFIYIGWFRKFDTENRWYITGVVNTNRY
jgi:hypothetical protein